MYDKKQEQQFRKTCANWLAKIAKVLSPFFPISAPCHYHYGHSHYGHSTRWHTHRMIQCQSCLVLLHHCCYLLEVSHHPRVMFPMRSLPSALAFSDITSCCFTSHIPLSLLLSLSPSPPHHNHHHYHHHTTITIITTIITPPLSLLSVIINHLSTMNITITTITITTTNHYSWGSMFISDWGITICHQQFLFCL